MQIGHVAPPKKSGSRLNLSGGEPGTANIWVTNQMTE